MTDARKTLYQKQIAKICEALEQRNIRGIYAPTREEAIRLVVSEIPRGATVGLGGSTTVMESGLLEELRKGDFNLLDRYQPNLTKEEVYELRLQNLRADVFISSTNAITLDGELVNIDGMGNRIAAMLFGPSKVVIIAGVNKIVEDVEAGIRRIKNTVAPMNSLRLHKNTPCAQTGICDEYGCLPPERICNKIAVIEGEYNKGRMVVVLVAEPMGY